MYVSETISIFNHTNQSSLLNKKEWKPWVPLATNASEFTRMEGLNRTELRICNFQECISTATNLPVIRISPGIMCFLNIAKYFSFNNFSSPLRVQSLDDKHTKKLENKHVSIFVMSQGTEKLVNMCKNRVPFSVTHPMNVVRRKITNTGFGFLIRIQYSYQPF